MAYASGFFEHDEEIAGVILNSKEFMEYAQVLDGEYSVFDDYRDALYNFCNNLVQFYGKKELSDEAVNDMDLLISKKKSEIPDMNGIYFALTLNEVSYKVYFICEKK